MYREYIWTLNLNTTFSLQAANKSEVYLLENVNWNNISNYQYFTIYNSFILPIANFWTTAQGLKLFNFAVKLGYDKNSLKTMIAAEIMKCF